MKKYFLFLLLSLFVDISANAQIQRKFYGLSLGSSTKKEALDYFTKQGMEVINMNDDSFFVPNVKFAGSYWSCALFSFYKDTFSCVYFGEKEDHASKDGLNIKWESLNLQIQNKYSKYFRDSMSTDNYKVYDDDITCLTLDYKYSNTFGQKTLSLMYIDQKIRKLSNKESEEEL